MAASLAIDGGPPVRSTLLPYGHQTIGEDDIAAVVDVLRGDWLTTGPAVDSFEQAVADYVEVEHVVAVSSGTAALHAAVHAAGVGPGDEVIVPALTFAATANCVRYQGARPVFADVLPDTGLIDPESVAAHLTSRTRAVIPVDYTGQPVDLKALAALCAAHNITLIEDAAQALGARYHDRPVGSIAPMTTFSTHPVKNIATGEGGLVTTNDSAIAEALRRFRNHGIQRSPEIAAHHGAWYYEMTGLGHNYRIPDVLCALGESQLTKLPAWLEARSAIAARYTEALAETAAIEPLRQYPDRSSAWHLYVVALDLEQLRVSRRGIFDALRAEGIGVNVHHIPVYWHPYYREMGYMPGLCPETEALYERILSLPLWPGMRAEDEQDVLEAVCKVLAAYRR